MHSTEINQEATAESAHLGRLLQINTKNLQQVEQQISEIHEQPANFVPTVLFHTLRETQQKINDIYQRRGEKPPYQLTEPDINPRGYAIQTDLSADRIAHLQKLLTVYHLNLIHAQAEASRLAQRNISHPIITATIQQETDNISLTEKFLYQIPTGINSI